MVMAGHVAWWSKETPYSMAMTGHVAWWSRRVRPIRLEGILSEGAEVTQRLIEACLNDTHIRDLQGITM